MDGLYGFFQLSQLKLNSLGINHIQKWNQTKNKKHSKANRRGIDLNSDADSLPYFHVTRENGTKVTSLEMDIISIIFFIISQLLKNMYSMKQIILSLNRNIFQHIVRRSVIIYVGYIKLALCFHLYYHKSMKESKSDQFSRNS